MTNEYNEYDDYIVFQCPNAIFENIFLELHKNQSSQYRTHPALLRPTRQRRLCCYRSLILKFQDVSRGNVWPSYTAKRLQITILCFIIIVYSRNPFGTYFIRIFK